MSKQYLKLRRSAVPGKIPDTASLDFGEIAVNTHDGKAYMKRSSSNGEEVVAVGSLGSFTGSFSGSFIGPITGSVFGTASWAINALTASSADDFLVRGTLTAQTIVAQVITASTEYITGSTIFGSELSDTHDFTGSVRITGSLGINGIDYEQTSASFDSRILVNSASISDLSSSFLTTSGSTSIRLTDLEQFSSSLDSTYATDAELNAATASLSASIEILSSSFLDTSGSLSTRVTDLEYFSSSLDTTFATDAELNAATASLSSSIRILSSSFLDASASFDTRILSNSSSIADLSSSFLATSGSASTRLTDLEQFSSSLDATFATDVELNAATASLSSSISILSSSFLDSSASFDTRILENSSSIATLSGSFLSTSGSLSTRVTDLEYFSSSLDATFATDAELNQATASLSASISNLSSSFLTTSGSTSTRLTDLEQFSSSLDATFATDAELNVATASLSSSISILSSSFLDSSASFNNRILTNSSSISDLSSSFLAFSSSYNTGSFTGSFNGFVSAVSGTATYIPYFNTSTTLANSAIYQVGSNSIAINEDNVNIYNPEALYVFQTNTSSINVISGKGNLNNYLQLNIQNVNQGNNASSDVVATANNGDEFFNYIDMGINSEDFVGYIGGSNDAYLYSTGRHLHIGNVSNFPIQFFVGGADTDINRKLQLSPDNIHELTGSLIVSSGSITSSLFGTASWAENFITSSVSTSSFALTASSADNFLVRGTLTAQTIVAQVITASTEYVTGSTIFGSQLSNTHEFTGSVKITGSLSINNVDYELTSASFDTRILASSSSISTLSSSFLTVSSSNSTRLTSLEQFSSSLDATFATDAELNSATASLSASIGVLSSSFLNASSSFDVRILANSSSVGALSSSFLVMSGSTSTRLTSLEQFSSSLDATFATDAELNTATASLSGSISALSSSFLQSSASFNTRILNNSSSIAALSSSFIIFSGSYNTGSFTGSFIGDGSGLKNIPASGVVGLNLSLISSGSVTASTDPAYGFKVNSNTQISGSTQITGSLGVTGSVSIIGQSVSTNADTLIFTGSMFTTGSINHTGSINVLGGVTASLFGTASWAQNFLTSSVTSASLAQTASYVQLAQSASYVLNAISSSYAFTASSAINSFTATSASYASISTSSSYSISSSYANYALTSSYAINITVSGSITDVDYINFDTGSAFTNLPGRLGWDNGENTLQLGLSGGNVQLSMGEQMYQYCFNAETSSLTKGQVVFISGSQGNQIAVKLAAASAEFGSANTLGFVAETIAIGGSGWIQTAGNLRRLNTTGLVAGELLYLSSSAGQYTQTKPISPIHEVRLGFAERINATVGSIYIKIDNGYELGELHDVVDNTTTSSYGDLLVKSGSVWHDSKQLTGSYGLTGSLNIIGGITSSLFGTASWAQNATTSSYALIATTASHALSLPSDINISASNIVVTSDLVVNGTASFNYVEQVTGSAVIVGQEYIILNTQIPAARFAGLVIFDSGSNATASIVWDSEKNHLVYQNTSGASYTGGGFLSGPRNTGSLGEEPYPSFNRVVRGQGGDHLYNSNIYDDSTAIRLEINSQVTGSLTVSNGITGSLFGTASWAQNFLTSSVTSASLAQTASYVQLAQTASYALNSVSASYALTAAFAANVPDTASYALFALTSSYAVTASSAINSFNAVSSSYSSTASYVQLAQTSSYVQLAQTASYILNAVSASYAFTASSATNAFSALTASYIQLAQSASYVQNAQTASYIVNAISSSYAFTASSAINSFNAVSSSYAVTASSAVESFNAVSASYANSASISVSSSFSNNSISASYALTASYALNGGGGASLSGGSTNYVARWSSSVQLTTGSIYDTGTNVGIGSTTPGATLDVVGNIRATSFTGSLFGTASWATNFITSSVTSASYAFTASSAIASFTAVSSSYAFTASSAVNSTTALTASSADNFVVRQSLTASNALINGTITAQTLVVSTVSSSVVYSSGSNIFGNQLTNVQQFTGSLRVTGSGDHWILGGSVGIGTTTPSTALTVNGGITSNAFLRANLNGSDTIGLGAFTALYNTGFTTAVIQQLNANNGLDWWTLASGNWTKRATFTADGNFGLGVTPSAWSVITALQVGSGASLSGYQTDEALLAANTYYNSGFKYAGTGYATAYQQQTGQHKWLIAGTSTAGNAISFTQAMTLTANGRLLLGTTGEQTYRLAVAGDVKFDADAATNGFYWNNTTKRLSIGTTTAISTVQVAGQTRQLYAKAFTANPLDIDGYAGHIIVNSNNANGDMAGIGLYTNNSYTAAGGIFALQESSNAASLVFYAGSNFATERMRITSGGNVGIGTTSPTQKLHLNIASGVIYTRIENNLNSLYLGLDSGGIAQISSDVSSLKVMASTYTAFETGGSERMRIASGGNVGIGTTSPTLATLQVNGNVHAASFTGSLFGSSSYAQTASYSSDFTVANTLTIDQTLTDYATVASSVVGSNNLFTRATGSFTSAFFKYTMSSGSNSRSGEVIAVWNGATAEYTDFSTVDIGNTNSVTASAAIVTSQIQFNMQTNTGGWRIKTLATFM